uniref:Uncharacterized protein n=1 Tax=Aegilops tauschii TaxID=37682 RepID=N1QT80_AEGTA
MARIRTDRSLRRRPQPSRGDDLMSALPDDLLLLVLRRLDTRTALGTALLSRRWARLHRELPVLDFRPRPLPGGSRVVPAKPQTRRLRAPGAARVQRAHHARPARHYHIDAHGSLRGRLHLVPAAAGATRLHLKSLECPWEDADLVVDAPTSQIRELVFNDCRFRQVRVRALPNLESLASRGTALHFDQSASFPRLRQCNHTTRVDLVFIRGGRLREYIGHRRELGSFLGRTPYITNLILRFTGPRRWIVPPPSGSSSPLLPNLRKLLVADVPSSWDVSWPRLLLEMATSLETLHIHIAPCNQRAGRVIPWEPTELRRRRLKELVVAGFQGTKRQICFVKFVVGVSTSLRHVALFRNGRAEDKGHWDWEMVTEQHSWTNRQKNATQKKIMDGVSFSRPPPQFVFG